MSSILFIPALTLVALSLSLAPLGCFLVWRRLAFFGDGMSHACTFGVAVAFVLKIHFLAGILITALIVAALLFLVDKHQKLSLDTLFSLISYSLFAAGIVALSFMKDARFNIEDILFGDFLAMDSLQLFLTCLMSLITFVFLRVYWPVLLLTCLSSDLATITYAKETPRANVGFILLAALIVAFGMYLIGALLLPALMILPAASAQSFSHSPRQMVSLSFIFSVLGCMLGVSAAYAFNTPPSATMVLAGSFIFLISLITSCIFKKGLSHV